MIMRYTPDMGPKPVLSHFGNKTKTLALSGHPSEYVKYVESRNVWS